jgi:Bacteriocin-protection, YdeI or OmpD-Associated
MDLDVIPTGKTTATVILTQDQVDAVRGTPGRGRVMLAITYQDEVFRTSVSVYRGEWMMVVNEAMRAGGMMPPGTYTVDIAVDTAVRTVDVPTDLADAITAAGLTGAWEHQSYTNRKEFVRGVVEAKKPETRERRIEKVISSLGG